MSETSQIVTPAIEALNAIPRVWARRLHSGKVKVRGAWMRLGEAGCPDLMAVVDGRVLFFEAKLPKELVTEVQLAEHGRIRRAGGTVHVVRSVREVLDVVRVVLDGRRSA